MIEFNRMQIQAEPRRTRRAAGVIIPLVAVLLVALLGALGIVMLRNYSLLLQAELQTAADSAAHAAAASLCSSKRCWDGIPSVVADTLDQFRAAGSRSSTALSLEGITPEIDENGAALIWDATTERNLIVRVERGRWLPSDPFTSYEDSWQKDHEGDPAFLVSNAVRVTVERPSTWIPSFVLSSSVRFQASATAVAGAVETQCAAPFAIPACALVNSGGEFQGPDICRGDRFFTQADRYCTGRGNCRSYPWQPYGLCDEKWAADCSNRDNGGSQSGLCRGDTETRRLEQIASSALLLSSTQRNPYRTVATEDSGSEDLPVRNSAHYCATSEDFGSPGVHLWPNQQLFSETIDHFGVVGLPRSAFPKGANPNQFEDLIVAQLSSKTGSPCFDTAIGERFVIAPAGLTKKTTDPVVWQTISDTVPERIPDPSRPTFRQTLGSLDGYESNIVFKNNGISYLPNFEGPTMCQSHRAVWVDSRANDKTVISLQQTPDINDTGKVWRIKIPVIAPSGSKDSGGDCQGLQGSEMDPVINPGLDFEVVGFVDAVIYDNDIGGTPSKSGELADEWYSTTVPNDEAPDIPPQPRINERCNEVRARISCDNTFIPTSDNTSPRRTPRLVQ